MAYGMKFDEAIEWEVKEELQGEPSIKAEGIGISVKAGMVTLMGYVHTFSEKWVAEEAVKRISGIRGLATRLGSGSFPQGNAQTLKLFRHSLWSLIRIPVCHH